MATEREELLGRLSAVRQWESGGTRAPHKPLLLLYALARVQAGKARLVAFAEAEPQLRRLLADCGPSRPTTPLYPFWYLPGDGLWEVPERDGLVQRVGKREPTVAAMRAGAHGGLPDRIDRMVRNDPALAREAAQSLLERHFEPSLHAGICSSLGLEAAAPVTPAQRERRKRDRAFGQRVLVAYEMRCAMCGWSVHLGGDALGLEAAHDFWHTLGGPDELDNGLCLCALHHLALDRGAVSVDDDRAVRPHRPQHR